MLDAQHGLLGLFFFFGFSGVCEQIQLIAPFILYDPDGGDCDPAHSQRFITDLVEQIYSRSYYLAGKVGRVIEFCRSICAFGNPPTAVVDVYRAILHPSDILFSA